MLDGIFFIASKIVWALISPDSLIVLLGLAAWLSLLLGWSRLSRWLLSLCTLLLLTIGFLPVGEWLISPLENRFAANTALPARADGIVVLGGPVSPTLSQIWGQVEMGGSAERLTSLVYLARLYTEAQLVYTGGSGQLTQQTLKGADYARYLFDQVGLGERAIIYESESRNTAENAVNSRKLVNPRPDQNWILVTSAFHMSRSVGVFCQQEWPVIPYPVDHYAQKGRLWRIEFDFSDHLKVLRIAMREWVGLVAYRLTGRSSILLAGDSNYCGAPS